MRGPLILTGLAIVLLGILLLTSAGRCEECPLLCQTDEDCCSGVCVTPKGGTWGNCEEGG